MEFRYVTAVQLQGILHSSDDPEVILADQPEIGLRAVVTSDIDAHCFIVDRQLALATMMLKGLVGQSEVGDFEQRLQEEIERIREQRMSRMSGDAVIVVEIFSDIEATVKEPLREIGEFVLCFEAFDKNALREELRHSVAAVVTAMFMASDYSHAIVKLTEEMYLIRDDGKVVHSFSPSVGAVNAYVSKRVDDKVIRFAQEYSKALIAKSELRGVTELFAQALDRNLDPLKAFIFGWSSLEVLVNKIFSQYEKAFISQLVANSPTGGAKRYFDRITQVMKDKYTLVDKFGVIALFLAGDSAEEDTALFQRLKKIRDELYHGQEILEATLPNRDLQDLITRYFRKHIEN